MLTRPIPSTGEPLPVIGLGTYRSFNVSSNPFKKKDLQEVLRLFYADGGRLIDSSPMYGKSEAVIGDVRQGVPGDENAFMATKVWTSGRQKGIDEMDASFRKMGCDGHMELMQIHNMVDTDTHLDTLKEWKAAGKIKYIGITHYTESAFGEMGRYIKQEPEIDFCQFPYSIDRRAAEEYFLDLCSDHGVATLINRPFEQDGLFADVRRAPLPEWADEMGITSWAQYFLKYLLSFDAVTCLIPATGNPEHMADNLKAGQGHLPDRAERAQMVAYFNSM
ncbi:MAG: aldo/keto reductase [Rhodospirillaceae bacterium]